MTNPSPDPLLLELREYLAERDRPIACMEAIGRDLRTQLDAAEKAGKRQAAPFSKGEPKPDPKAPGGKPGDAQCRHGHRPVPDAINETYEAPLPDRCPDCGGDVAEDRLDEQYQTESPRKPPRSQVQHTLRPRRRLRQAPAGAAMTSRLVTPPGAARSQLGPNAQAASVHLNEHAGVPHGKIAAGFGQLFGVGVTRRACAQVVSRADRKRTPAYREIADRLRNSRSVTPRTRPVGASEGAPSGYTAGSETTGPPCSPPTCDAVPIVTNK